MISVGDYENLVRGDIPYYIINAPQEILSYGIDLHVIPGSYNPIHRMHRLLYDSATDYARNTCQYAGVPSVAYEISLVRRGKEGLSYEELCSRLQQFHPSEMVIVTACDFMVKKAGALHDASSLTFHIGYDTAKRFLADDTLYGIEGIDARFVVYPRDGHGLNELAACPYNMREGTYVGQYMEGISSTGIRAAKEL